MIEPAQVLEGIRDQLRESVLPALEDENARSVVFAALGILGDLALRVQTDERWCRASAKELDRALERSSAQLDGRQVLSERLAALRGQAAAEPSPARAREILLTGAAELLGAIWRDERLWGRAELLADIRRVLAGDLARQLETTR